MRQRTHTTLAAAVGFFVTSAVGKSEKVGYACDGSAIASIGEGYFWNGSDEDNILRLYKAGAAAKPLNQVNLNPHLKTEVKEGGQPKEADIEAVARIGNRLYWIGSHGRSKKNPVDEPSRRLLFATDLSGHGAASNLRPVGTPFRGLVAAAKSGTSVVSRALLAAEPLAPGKGGVNIEGMAATTDGSLLIGFRSPLVGGRAIVLRLRNPAVVIEKGSAPEFGNPMLLDLGGLGIRDIGASAVPDEFWILAGSAGSGGTSAIYIWRPGHAPVASQIELPAAEGPPEGLMRDISSGSWFMSTDKGDLDGCKKRKEAKRTFELLPLTLK